MVCDHFNTDMGTLKLLDMEPDLIAKRERENERVLFQLHVAMITSSLGHTAPFASKPFHSTR